MNLIKCPNGHFYNADKLKICPHCANEKIHITNDTAPAIRQRDIDTYVPDNKLADTYSQISKRLVSGWLVCIAGNMKGDCFSLYTGNNHIGRDTSMDVMLFKEPTVSRSNHALIHYDTNTAVFTLTTQCNSVLLNHVPVTSKQPVTLFHHDHIQIGDCILIFIPLCGPDFNWSES